MTANDQRELFKLLYNGASNVEMGYNNNEVSSFLNQATLYYIKERTFPIKRGTGYEVTSKRDAELVELKRYVEITTFSTASQFNNAISVTLPDDYLYNSRETVDILNNGSTYNRVSVIPKDEDEASEDISNPFREPYHRKVWRITQERVDQGITGTPSARRAILVTDSNTTVIQYNLNYIKYPELIVVDTRTPANMRNCELDASTHEEITKIAVRIALGAIGSQKYQIGINEESKDF